MRAIRQWQEQFFARFALAPSAGKTLPAMDGVRALAVLLVLVVHTWWFAGSPRFAISLPGTSRALDLTPFAEFAQVGVDLFFVLSGFLLAQQWMRADYEGRERPALRRYARQRLLRILPACYVCLFVVLALFTVWGIVDPAWVFSGAGALTLGAYLVLLHFLTPLTAGTFGVFGHLWTLTIEMLFYATLPWAVRCFLRNRWRVTLPLSLVAALGWLYLSRHGLGGIVQLYRTVLASPPGLPGSAFLYNPANPGYPSEANVRFFLARQFPAQFFHFALGITLANIYTRAQLRRDEGRLLRALTGPRAGIAYFVTGLAIVLGFMVAVSRNSLAFGYSYEKMITEPGATLAYYGNQLPFALGFTLIIAGILFGAAPLRAFFSIAPLRFIGICGYSIYLWHFPVLVALARLPGFAPMTAPSARFWQLIGAALLILLPLGAASYLLIERPFMRRARRAAPDPRPDPLPVPARAYD